MDADRSIILANKISQNALLVSIWTIFGVLSVLLVGRYTIRLVLHRRLFCDDVFVALGYIFLLTHNIITTVIAPTAFELLAIYRGGPIPENVIGKTTHMIKFLFAANFLYLGCLYSVKASLLALLWRLFNKMPLFRRAWWVVTCLVVLSVIISTILVPISCSDWTAFGCLKPDNITKESVTLYFTVASDIITDIMIMSLPVAFILKSTLPFAQKAGLVVLFTLGFAVIAFAILRIVEVDGKSKHPSPTWLLFWSTMECSVAVIVSCVAAYKSLFSARSRSQAYAYRYQNTNSDNTSRKPERPHSQEEIMRSTEFSVTYEMKPFPQKPQSHRSRESEPAIPASALVAP